MKVFYIEDRCGTTIHDYDVNCAEHYLRLCVVLAMFAMQTQQVYSYYASMLLHKFGNAKYTKVSRICFDFVKTHAKHDPSDHQIYAGET